MTHLEVLVEEPSCEAMLVVLLPVMAPSATFNIRVFNGKPDLLRKLPQRLPGYVQMIKTFDLKVVVLLDRDQEDCLNLKEQLEGHMSKVGLATLRSSRVDQKARACTRIVCEELEAWFLGDVPALCAAYPRIPATLESQQRFRNPDTIKGGTAEALEHLLAEHGYGATLAKIATARAVAPHMDVENNRSASFRAFRDGVRRLTSDHGDA